ncbi:MAG: matrixin family metalloprotease, partial [Rhizomicrobium sp.]
MEEATELWETAAGRKLFIPGARGPLKINLVYDSRQEATQRVIAARASISEKLKEADEIKDRLLPLRNKYDDLDEAYSGQLTSYQRLHDDHNKIAAQSNAKGGAPEAEYQQLLGERLSLRKQADALRAKQLELNRLTDDINALVNRHNGLLRRANAEANALNEAGITGVAFEEGLYVRQSGEEQIAVFQYEGETALRVILSHELGHALGIRHNANPSSIMSPLIHTGRLALTAED